MYTTGLNIMKAIHYVFVGLMQPGDKFDTVRRRIDQTETIATALFNTAIRKDGQRVMQQEYINCRRLFDEDDFAQLSGSPDSRRFILSFFPHPMVPPAESVVDAIGGFLHQPDGCIVTAGFRRVDSNPMFAKKLDLNDGTSVIRVEDEKNLCFLVGPGPGAEIVAAKMIRESQLQKCA